MTTLAKLEALLFLAGEDGLTLRQLAELLELPPTGIQQSLEKLANKYEEDASSALALLQSSNSYKLVTKEAFAELLKNYAKTPVNQSLSRASLEVLSIIAYKQPITRLEVDTIRGVNSSGAIAKLQALGLVTEAGKLETIGRPNLYATTDFFLDYLGINDLAELIDVSSITVKEEEISLFDETDTND
ncbi:SMC-Scp complex subunit ScpB [Streptococcus loxodontisalivarius]|uniref:Segregation and condensation protein B n=1 Tax=Streptococcus loxodontisalivarius TaxID=1349415 RepID=A0ABS2PQQ6_9STRE|nr:SMC-Scp complex subunit ScpB [Streptococcus loxodontisalivarius]MBM7642373.1 segregation and condensation protein B [Streptococcus loxodontisalivarius]